MCKNEIVLKLKVKVIEEVEEKEMVKEIFEDRMIKELVEKMVNKIIKENRKINVRVGLLLESPGVVRFDLTPPSKLVEVKLSQLKFNFKSQSSFHFDCVVMVTMSVTLLMLLVTMMITLTIVLLLVGLHLLVFNMKFPAEENVPSAYYVGSMFNLIYLHL